MLLAKIEWYKKRARDLKESIDVTNEAKSIEKAAVDRDYLKLQRHKSGILHQKEYHDSEADKLRRNYFEQREDTAALKEDLMQLRRIRDERIALKNDQLLSLTDRFKVIHHENNKKSELE